MVSSEGLMCPVGGSCRYGQSGRLSWVSQWLIAEPKVAVVRCNGLVSLVLSVLPNTTVCRLVPQ